MAEVTLTMAALSTLVVGATYAYVGSHLLKKGAGVAPGSRALRLFGLWWLATALNQALGGALYLAASLGYTSVDAQLAYVVLQRLLLAISLVGLMYYLLYLQTGRRAFWPLVAVYATYWVLTVYSITARQPTGVDVHGWRTDLAYAVTLHPAWELLPLVIAVPPVVAALGLLRLYRRVETPTQRFRVAMIGGGFVVWWLLAVVAGHPSTFDVGWLQAANRVVGVAIALGILLAYDPAAWMQRRYQIEPYESHG